MDTNVDIRETISEADFYRETVDDPDYSGELHDDRDLRREIRDAGKLLKAALLEKRRSTADFYRETADDPDQGGELYKDTHLYEDAERRAAECRAAKLEKERKEAVFSKWASRHRKYIVFLIGFLILFAYAISSISLEIKEKKQQNVYDETFDEAVELMKFGKYDKAYPLLESIPFGKHEHLYDLKKGCCGTWYWFTGKQLDHPEAETDFPPDPNTFYYYFYLIDSDYDGPFADVYLNNKKAAIEMHENAEKYRDRMPQLGMDWHYINCTMMRHYDDYVVNSSDMVISDIVTDFYWYRANDPSDIVLTVVVTGDNVTDIIRSGDDYWKEGIPYYIWEAREKKRKEEEKKEKDSYYPSPHSYYTYDDDPDDPYFYDDDYDFYDDYEDYGDWDDSDYYDYG